MITTLALVLADEDPDEMARLIDDAGPIAGLFVLILLIVMFFLWRSLTKQIKKIDPSLPAGQDDLEQAHDRELTEEALERGEAAAPQPDEPTGS
jgi:hypothetical protein